jgi:hypothetical protein
MAVKFHDSIQKYGIDFSSNLPKKTLIKRLLF